MNLLLFDPDELTRPLPLGDPRAAHLRDVLRRATDETFDCGLVDGPRGKGRIVSQDGSGLHLAFAWGAPPPPLPPLSLLVGLPRPQTARKVLGEAAAIGVSAVRFFRSERGEPSYAASHLWTGGEARRHLLAGVAQAFCTRVPELSLHDSLTAAFASGVVASTATRLALDNYEASAPFAATPLVATPAVLAIGPERGWSARERDALRAAGFTLVHLGERVLRVETACVAGLTLLKARLGLLS